MTWLLTSDEAARIRGIVGKVSVSASEISAAQVTAKDPDVQIVDGVAAIDVRGVLSKKVDRWLSYFGVEQTAYTDISTQIAQAKQRGAKKIVLNVDSGGGSVDGLYDAMKAIRNSGIYTEAVVDGTAASAAYMLASQANRIVAKNEMSIIGSIGVATSVFLPDGVVKDITNRESADKRPDVSTEEGVAVVQDFLDDVYGVIAPMVADARGIDVKAMNENYGNGAIMTARSAISRGMIDAIGQDRIETAVKAAATTGVKRMDKQQLKAEHPDLFAAVIEEGRAIERAACLELIAAHLELAEASGDNARALADIKAMNPVGQAVMAHHAAAGIRKAAVAARQEEAPAQVVQNTVAGEVAEADPLMKEKAALNAVAENAGVKVEW